MGVVRKVHRQLAVVGLPVMGGSINDIFMRKVNAIRTGDIFGMLF